MPSLRFEKVSFGYERKRFVLREFNFEFSEGSTLLLGPNGAGKTTLLSLGASVFRPASGIVTFAGTSATHANLRTYRRRVAWMPQQIRPMPGLTAREQVAYVGWLKGLSRAEAWERSLPALDRVGLAAYSDRRPGRLSGGELRRLGVAQTLVHDAALVLMDEPTAGLDPAQRADFRELVSALRETVTLVISTHQTEDIDASYDHVAVLNTGTICFSGTVDRFLALAAVPQDARERVVAAYRHALELRREEP